MIKSVTSLQNPVIKQIRALDMRKERKETGLFVAEGAKVVATARDLGWKPRYLLFKNNTGIISELSNWALKEGAECFEVTDDILSKLSTKDNPQGIIGVFHQRFEEAVPEKGLWVALEEVRDPGNLGTIIRTCDAVGAKGIILIGPCCDAYSREAVRASMGSIFAVPLVKVTKEGFLKIMSNWRGDIIGTHLSGKESFRRAYTENTLLVMGSEGPGLSDTLAEKCTTSVKIPMKGAADSLNLAVATALMLYEIKK